MVRKILTRYENDFLCIVALARLDGVRNVMGLLGAGNKKIRRLKAKELMDDSVVKNWKRKAGSNGPCPIAKSVCSR
jgi:hypothetical protein